MEACPRSARMPPPGRPMLPSSSCKMAAVRMYCTPTVCWVQPTLYTNAVVRSGPELAVSASQTWRERVRRHAADLLDHLRGVAGEVPLQHLEHAPGVLQRLVPVRVGVRRGPAGTVRLAASRLRTCRARAWSCVAGRVAVAAAACTSPPRSARCRSRRCGPRGPSRRTRRPGPRCPEILGHDGRRVGVGDDVLAEVLLVRQHVVDDPAEEDDVAARRAAARAGRPARWSG